MGGGQEVRAAVFDRPGEPLSVETLGLDEPRAGEVLVRMLASGVCHSDLHIVEGEWQGRRGMVLGHEGCGVVEAVAPDVTSPRVGDLVVLSWMASCGRCAGCRAGRPWTCTETRALENLMPDGTTRLHRADGSEAVAYLGLGTFAERAVVPASAAIPVDSAVPAEVAALIGCCVSTGVGAVLRTADVHVGASVAVVGLGGVGLSVIMGAVLAGAGRIVAIDRVAEKLERARAVGATHVVQASGQEETVEAVREATGGGADFAFEAVGLSSTIELAIGSVRTGGTAVLVGMTPEGVRPSFDAFDLVDRSLRILGSNYGFTIPDVDFPRYADLHVQGRLPIDRLIDERISLDQVNPALDEMRGGRSVRRVIVY